MTQRFFTTFKKITGCAIETAWAALVSVWAGSPLT